MKKESNFTLRYQRNLLLIIVLVASQLYLIQSITYCSAYCSYYNQGGAYSPMCNDQTSAQCIKCDEYLFSLSGTTCQPHQKYNQTLQITDLVPPLGALGTWSSTAGNYRINTRSGLYELLEFYTSTTIPIGGDDLVYKVFTNLAPHYTVRVRFFVLRVAGASMSFYYYIDNKRYEYIYSQYPSSQNLGDIVTTDKIFHQDTNLTIAFESKFSGNNQFIGVKQLLIFISKCSLNCLFCNSSQNCVQCGVLSNGTQSYLHSDGYCYVDCPENYFQNGTLNSCDVCLKQCQNCNTNSSHCVQCKFQGIFETFLLNSTCYYNCPNGFFQQFQNNTCICPVNGYYQTATHFCQACAPQCNSCFGPLRTQCYNCSVGHYLVKGTNWCSNICPSDQYGDQFARICTPCAPICSSCQNTSTQCRGCFFTNKVSFLYQYKCINDCPTGYGKNYALRSCDKCPPFYYSYNGQCIIQCPSLYVANNESKSCLHISQTNFTYQLKVSKASVLIDGRSIVFSIDFPNGLSQNSKAWLYSQSYYNSNLKSKQFKVASSSINIQNDNLVSLMFKLSDLLSENSDFVIDLGKKLNSNDKIFYSQTTNTFKISQYPDFLKQYYKKGEVSYFNMILIPIFLILATLICMRHRATYQLLIQNIRAFQTIGLGVFLSYPMSNKVYFLFEGLNYFNFQFFPNIYNILVPKFSNSLQKQYFQGFKFLYGDMDFIRMIGSIILFIVFWVVMLIVFKYLISKNIALLGWLLKLGMDLVQIKILHSFWSSLIFTIANEDKYNLYILWVHAFSYIWVGAIAFRYYKIYKSQNKINYMLLWRVASTLLISIAVFSRMIVMIFAIIVSIGFGIIQYIRLRELNKQTEKFKFGIAFKIKDLSISAMPFASIMGICLLIFYKQQMDSLQVIIIFSVFAFLLIFLSALIMILLNYFYKYREKTVVAQIKKNSIWKNSQIFNQLDNNSTFQNASDSNFQNESYIKDEFVDDFQKMNKDVASSKNANENQTFYEIDKKSHLKRNDEQSSEDGPIEQKFKRLNLTQVIKKKPAMKVGPLQRVQKQIEGDEEVSFQNIALSPTKDKKAQINLKQKSSQNDNVFIEKSNSIGIKQKNKD